MIWVQSCISISAYLHHRSHLFNCDADLHQSVLHLLRVVWLLALTAHVNRPQSKMRSLPHQFAWMTHEFGKSAAVHKLASTDEKTDLPITPLAHLQSYQRRVWFDLLWNSRRSLCWRLRNVIWSMIVINWKECGNTCYCNDVIYSNISCYRVTAVAQWLRCCATNRKVAGSIPDGVLEVFH